MKREASAPSVAASTMLSSVLAELTRTCPTGPGALRHPTRPDRHAEQLILRRSCGACPYLVVRRRPRKRVRLFGDSEIWADLSDTPRGELTIDDVWGRGPNGASSTRSRRPARLAHTKREQRAAKFKIFGSALSDRCSCRFVIPSE